MEVPHRFVAHNHVSIPSAPPGSAHFFAVAVPAIGPYAGCVNVGQTTNPEPPVWAPAALGNPLPASTHAVSVALPRWRDVVGYEEKSPEVMSRLSSGYPRFVVHPLVAEAGRQLAGNRPCLPFPSARVAAQCSEFVRQSTGEAAEVLSKDGLFGVATSEKGNASLRAFWQHTGLIVSTRQAEAFLGRIPGTDNGAPIRQTLRQRLAALYDCDHSDVFLAPTGMGSVFTALQAVATRRPGIPSAQLGFPYVDTLKLQEKFGGGALLLAKLADVPRKLEERLTALPKSLSACFCEIPGNPLLGSVDLGAITPLLRNHGVPLVIDDAVATPFNIDLSRHADLVVTSLTKFFAGSGDVMGGALICNPRSPLYNDLKALVSRHHEELLWADDAVVLERTSRDFAERVQRHNRSGLFIAEKLRTHPAVEQVWYPKWECAEAYEQVRRPKGGWGALLAFVARDAARTSAGIYDRLAVPKGPSLGTTFTLACPFTLLAHFTELDWAESCGVSRYLIRVSVGLEEPEELWNRFSTALQD